MSSGVYEIRNTVNGKRYIGSAADIESRLRQHRKYLKSKKGHHSILLQRAWNKYGADAFELRALLYCGNDKETLLDYEQRCITGLSPEYNICKVAGSRRGAKLTEEGRIRFSAARKALKMKLSPEHCASMSAARIGKKMPPFTDEHRANMSKAHTGKKRGPLSPEHRAAISKGNLGKKLGPLSAEHRAKLSKALAGKKLSPEHVAKLRKANTGVKFTAERIANMRAARLGTKLTAEQRANISKRQTGTKRGPYRAKISKAHSGDANG